MTVRCLSYLPGLDELDKFWVGDTEGNGLLPTVTKIFVGVFINARTDEEVILRTDEEFRTWVSARKAEGCRFVFHNAVGYDGPALNKCCGTKFTISDLVDTMVMSLLYSPSLEGGHSLKAWGKRLGYPKTEFDDFTEYTPEMEEYCRNDTRLGKKVFLALVQRMKAVGFTDRGIELEHRSWQLIKKQQDNGFAFNYQEASVLYSLLQDKVNELTKSIRVAFPAKLQHIKTFKSAKKKDGSWGKGYLTHKEQYQSLRVNSDNTYDAFDYIEFNIGSPQQRVEKLLALGWKNLPDEVTKTGQPSPTKKGQLVPSLVAFIEESGNTPVADIARWIEVNARASMVNTWMEAWNESTGCIHGSLWLANTLRYTHSNPNTANIPAVRIDKEGVPLLRDSGGWTYEARDLWGTRDSRTRCLVGVDAKGIQLRVLAHYLNNEEFIKEVLNGDPHSYNQEIGGFRTRSIAKTFIYAFLLGAGDEKVGQIIGGSTSDGKTTKARFIRNFPGLGDLLADLKRQVERAGRIILCDGTPVVVRHIHTRLGYLLQGDESRLMKQAAIISDREIRRRKLDVLKVGDIHDEWQNDVLSRHAEEFAGEVCPLAFAQAGESFGYRLRIDCDAKVGMTWAQTH